MFKKLIWAAVGCAVLCATLDIMARHFWLLISDGLMLALTVMIIFCVRELARKNRE